MRVLYVRVDTPKAELAQPENAAEQRKCTHENTWSATLVRVTDKKSTFVTPETKVTQEV